MESLAAIAITDIVSCVVAACVASVVATVKAQGRKVSERSERERVESEAMKAGMRALLWLSSNVSTRERRRRAA